MGKIIMKLSSQIDTTSLKPATIVVIDILFKK